MQEQFGFRISSNSGRTIRYLSLLRRPSVPALKRQKPQKSRRTELTRLEAMSRVLRKGGFSYEDARNTAKAVRSSSAKLYEARWKYFCDWCVQRDIHRLKASFPKIVSFISHLREDLKLLVTASKDTKLPLTKSLNWIQGTLMTARC